MQEHGMGSPRRLPDDGADDNQSRRGTSLLRETVIVIALALVIATLVRIFLVQAFLIPSRSMENTLLVSDRVLVNKLSTRFGDIERGDVIVFSDPNGWLGPQPNTGIDDAGSALRQALEFVGILPESAEGHLIKRVIGVGGDRVTCCDDQGRVAVNGVPLDETGYLHPGDAPSLQEFDVTVPPGQLWVMGDHRSDSGDSRVNGYVPLSRVSGRAFVIVWPVSHWSGLTRPATFADIPAPQP
jgi:signal peptidase I